MFCVACMIFAFDDGVQFALALLFTSRNQTNANRIRMCVCFNEV